MPFTRPTIDTLRRDTRAFVQARLPGSEPDLRHSLLGILADAEAGLAHLQFGYLDWMFRQLIPDTSEGEFLDRWARLVGLTRKPETQAAGSVTFTGSAGVPVDLGTQLSQPNGVTYETTSAAVIGGGGSVVVPVQAVLGGDAGNLATGIRLTMVTAVPGLFNTATVAAPGLSGGGAAEADAALRDRLRERLSNPPQGGSAADYVAWALSVPGVTRAWAYPQARGAGTVDVAFVMDGRTDIIPLPGDVADVQAVIDLRRPVTADAFVFAPTAAPLDITITGLTPDTSAIRAAVVEQIEAQIRRDAVPGGTIRRSRLIGAVDRAAGEVSHEMTLPAADVSHATGEIAVPGVVTFT